MNVPNLRKEERRPCILKHLEASKSKAFKVWQPIHHHSQNTIDPGSALANVKRSVQISQLSLVSPVFRSAKFKISHGCKDFDLERPLYFFQPETFFIFKALITFNSENEIEIDIPEEILMKENRGEIRKAFNPFFRGGNASMNNLSESIQFRYPNSDQVSILIRTLADRSPGGAAFLISKDELKFYYPNDRILVDNGDGTEDECKIRYVDKVFNGRFYSGSTYRVGIQNL